MIQILTPDSRVDQDLINTMEDLQCTTWVLSANHMSEFALPEQKFPQLRILTMPEFEHWLEAAQDKHYPYEKPFSYTQDDPIYTVMLESLCDFMCHAFLF